MEERAKWLKKHGFKYDESTFIWTHEEAGLQVSVMYMQHANTLGWVSLQSYLLFSLLIYRIKKLFKLL